MADCHDLLRRALRARVRAQGADGMGELQVLSAWLPGGASGPALGPRWGASAGTPRGALAALPLVAPRSTVLWRALRAAAPWRALRAAARGRRRRAPVRG